MRVDKPTRRLCVRDSSGYGGGLGLTVVSTSPREGLVLAKDPARPGGSRPSGGDKATRGPGTSDRVGVPMAPMWSAGRVGPPSQKVVVGSTLHPAHIGGMAITQNRQPAGVPSGGQFAPISHDEAAAVIAFAPPVPLAEWDDLTAVLATTEGFGLHDTADAMFSPNRSSERHTTAVEVMAEWLATADAAATKPHRFESDRQRAVERQEAREVVRCLIDEKSCAARYGAERARWLQELSVTFEASSARSEDPGVHLWVEHDDDGVLECYHWRPVLTGDHDIELDPCRIDPAGDWGDADEMAYIEPLSNICDHFPDLPDQAA